MFKFTNLPDWCMTGQLPAFYDTDSGTAVEQTAKLYGAIKTLIKETETAINQINQACIDFKNGIITDQETFTAHIDTIMHDYIAMIDEKIKLQDKEIEDSIVYIKNNIQETTDNAIQEMIDNNELTIKSVYDSTNESLSIVVSEVTE